MPGWDERNLYLKAIESWGEYAQLDQGIEEAAEFIQAINKWKRNTGVDNARKLVEEMADLSIMIGQVKALMVLHLGEEKVVRLFAEFKGRKLRRLQKLLKGTDNGEREGTHLD